MDQMGNNKGHPNEVYGFSYQDIQKKNHLILGSS